MQQTVSNPILEMIGIAKSFGKVKANDNVDFTLQKERSMRCSAKMVLAKAL